MSQPQYPVQRLHMQLQRDALLFAREIREIWHTMSQDERDEAMGYLRVYEHMLTNWGNEGEKGIATRMAVR